MKDTICAVIGIMGSSVASFFGGWDASLKSLVIFMVIDYISGLIIAGIFHTSPKSKTGALESRAGFKGLCRKGMALLFVLIGTRLDAVIGTNYIRDAICIGFIANELISIIENAGLMGLPVPEVLEKAIDILKNKESEE